MPPNTPGATPLFKNTGLSKSPNKRHNLRIGTGDNRAKTAPTTTITLPFKRP